MSVKLIWLRTESLKQEVNFRANFKRSTQVSLYSFFWGSRWRSLTRSRLSFWAYWSVHSLVIAQENAVTGSEVSSFELSLGLKEHFSSLSLRVIFISPLFLLDLFFAWSAFLKLYPIPRNLYVGRVWLPFFLGQSALDTTLGDSSGTQ